MKYTAETEEITTTTETFTISEITEEEIRIMNQALMDYFNNSTKPTEWRKKAKKAYYALPCTDSIPTP